MQRLEILIVFSVFCDEKFGIKCAEIEWEWVILWKESGAGEITDYSVDDPVWSIGEENTTASELLPRNQYKDQKWGVIFCFVFTISHAAHDTVIVSKIELRDCFDSVANEKEPDVKCNLNRKINNKTKGAELTADCALLHITATLKL